MKKKVFIFLFVFTFIISSNLPYGYYVTKAVTPKLINLNFIPVDSVIDTNRPIIYAVSSSSKSVYSINYETGEIKKIDFSLQPERITIANDKIYVALLKMQHQYYAKEPLKGAIGIIDASTFSISDQFDINTDPYDIEADANGNIYITPGSNQWQTLEVYSLATKTKVGEAGHTYMKSLIQLNPVNLKLYLLPTALSPIDISVYGFTQNTFKYLYDSPYHGDYQMSTNMRISPDGKYIFNGAGTIFNCTDSQNTDITYAGKLSTPFNDVTFSSSKIYAGLINGNIAMYDYNNFGYLSTISTSGKVVNIYSKNNLLISLSQLSENTFGVEVIDIGDNSLPLSMTYSYPEQGNSKVSVSGYIVFQFNKFVNIDPSKDVLGDCTIKDYVKNKITYDNNLILYYDNLSYNTKYTLKLNAAAIKDISGKSLTEDFDSEFVTGAEFERLYGSSRYETSVEISKSGGSHADYVVLANGEDFPDALCASPLAVKYGAPILLTYKSSLPDVVKNEIDRLQPKEVFLVGGTGVISDNIKIVLQNQGIKVTRISGVNRYETSLEVAKYINSLSNEVFVATGENYPDALSIAAYAGNKQIPIILTNKNKLSDKISNYISTKGINKSYVIGGTGVISDNVLKSLPNAERIAGSNRYETNYQVLARFPFVYGETYFATGKVFADALSGAALAGIFNNPIILVDNSMPDNIIDSIKQNKDIMKMKKILGGPGVVSDYIIKRIFG